MFNKHKIILLNSRIEWAEKQREQQQQRIYQLERDIKLICDHLKIEFISNPSSRVVRAKEKQG